MAAFLGFFLAKLLDPLGGVIALACGYFSSSKLSILWGSVLASVVAELALHALQAGRIFNPAIFLIGVCAMTAWAAFGHFPLRRWLKGSSQ